MGYIITDSQHYTDIADMLRTQHKTNALYYPATMANMVSRIPVPYKPAFSNGYRGIEVARVASSYRLARELGDDDIIYTHGSLPFSDITLVDVVAAGGLEVRDDDGRGKCDCSIFMGLVLRGIDWANSFYPDHTAANAKWDPETELDGMFTRDWGDRALDHQLEGAYHNLGIGGYSTIRMVVDFASYLRRNSYVLYDAERDGAITDVLLAQIEPGDVCMQRASETSNPTIVHMFVVAERNIRLWECTEGLSPQLSYSSISSRKPYIQLIARPDYRINATPGTFPVGAELLKWPWLSGGSLASYTESGITLTATDDQSLHIYGTTAAAVNYALRGLTNSEYVTLPAGTYRLSGMTGTGVYDANFAIQVRKADGTDFTTSVRCYDGHDVDFTLDATTNIIVRLYAGGSRTYDCTIRPSLVRIAQGKVAWLRGTGNLKLSHSKSP